MNNNIKVFGNEKFGQIRTVVKEDGSVWFVGKDVAEALGYEKARNAIATHVHNDDALKWGIIDNMGRTQETTIINESGLYSLILSSKLEKAREFKHWITSEVLPSIRKTGSYSTEGEKETRMLTVEDYLTIARMIATCRNERLPYLASVLSHIGITFDPAIVTQKKENNEIHIPVERRKPLSDEEHESVKRLLRTMSAKEASEKTGVPFNTIQAYRSTQKPSRKTAEHIVKCLTM